MERFRRVGIVSLTLFLFSDFYKAAFDALPGDVTAIFGVISLVCGAMVVKGLPRRIWVMGGYVLLMIVPYLFYPPATEYATDKAFRFFTVAMTAIIAGPLLVKDRQSLMMMARTILGICVIMATIMLFQIIQGLDFWRWQIFGISTISLGRGFGYGMVVAFFMMYTDEIKRSWMLVSILVFTTLIFGVGNRQGLVGAIVAIGAFWVTNRQKGALSGKILAVVGGLGIAIFLMAISSYMPSYAVERVLSSFDTEALMDASSQARLYIYSNAVDKFVDHPMGIGLGNFDDLGIKTRVADVHYPHNIYLESLVEGGIVAGVYFVMASFLAIFILLIRTQKEPHLSLMFMLFVMSTFVANLSSDIPGNKMMLSIMSISICMPKLETSENDE